MEPSYQRIRFSLELRAEVASALQLFARKKNLTETQAAELILGAFFEQLDPDYLASEDV